MRKIIALSLVLATMVTLTGCGEEEKETSHPQSETSSSAEVNVRPNLYSVYDAFDTILAESGYYDEGKTAFDDYLSKYELTLATLKTELQRDPSKNLAISKMLSDVGIMPSEVDWDTVSEVYELEVFKKAIQSSGNSTLYLTADRDEFVTMIRQFGYDPYFKLIKENVNELGIRVPVPDDEIVDKMLSELSPMDLLSIYPATSRIIDENTIELKKTVDAKAFYELARRNGYRYVSYYPTISGEDNTPVYMRDNVEGLDVPLWQAYCLTYCEVLYSKYNLSPKNAVFNVTNDGVEMWWSPSTGKTIELDVYESGLIRIVFGNDDRLEEYQQDITEAPEDTSPATAYSTIKDKLSSEYSFSTADFETFVAMVKIFDLPCGRIRLYGSADELNSTLMGQWIDAAVTYSTFLSSSRMMNITPYQYSEYLVKFVNTGRDDPNVTAALDIVEVDKDNPNSLATAASINPMLLDLYKQFTDRLLYAVNSNQQFLLSGYNSYVTSVEYIDEDALKFSDVKAQLDTVRDGSLLTYDMGREVFCNALGNEPLTSIYDNDEITSPSALGKAQDTISLMGSTSFSKDMSVSQALDLLMRWIGDGRSSITKNNLASIDRSSVNEWASLTLEEVESKGDAKKAMAAIVQEALNYADTDGRITGDGSSIIAVLFS